MARGQYTVEHNKYGMVIRGSIPVDDLVALNEAAKKRGFTKVDTGIASALDGATFVLVSEESGKEWRTEITAENAMRYSGDLEKQWLFGVDIGTSSLTLFLVLGDNTRIAGTHLLRTGSESGSVPHDSDDFGRCFRLLERFPDWRPRLAEVSARFPKWTPFITQWAEFEDLWREESPAGKCPKLYEKLQAADRASRHWKI